MTANVEHDNSFRRGWVSGAMAATRRMRAALEAAEAARDVEPNLSDAQAALQSIAELAHDSSTGPAVPDALWDIRSMAYAALDLLASDAPSSAEQAGETITVQDAWLAATVAPSAPAADERAIVSLTDDLASCQRALQRRTDERNKFAAELDACSQYLKPGELVCERIARELRDSASLLEMLAAERTALEAARAQAGEAVAVGEVVPAFSGRATTRSEVLVDQSALDALPAGAKLYAAIPASAHVCRAVAWPGLSDLEYAIEQLRETGNYRDEEGEATDALEDLLNALKSSAAPARAQAGEAVAPVALRVIYKDTNYWRHFEVPPHIANSPEEQAKVLRIHASGGNSAEFLYAAPATPPADARDGGHDAEVIQALRVDLKEYQSLADRNQRDARRYREVRRDQHWSVIDGAGETLRAEALDDAADAIVAKRFGADRAMGGE